MRRLNLHPGRPAGRLFYCLISVLVAVGVSRGAPPPQTPPATTTISDVIYRADGSTAAGTLLITWPAFTTADNRAVPAGSMSLAIGPFGAINLALVPNQNATPAGTYYKVVMKLNDGTTSEEFWVVPTLSPTTISAIRSQVVPAGVALQVVTRQYVDDQLATKANGADVVHRTGDESVDGVKQFTSSPTVPTPTTDPATANKAYVDASVAAINPNNFVQKSGDTMTGTLVSPQLDAARVGAVRFADRFANIQAAITDAGTTGSVVIPSHYAGTDGFTNPNSIPITDLRKSAIHVANVKMWGARGDGRASTGVVTTGGNTTIVDTTNSPWVSGDVGKVIVLYGSSFSPGLVTTIAAFTDSSHIVLASAPQQSISGLIAVWGTDDSTAIASAAAAITAKGNIGSLYFPQGIYLSSASLAFVNAQGLQIYGDGPGSSASLANWNATGQPGTGSSLVWIGGQGGVLGCTSNSGAPPAGVAGATQNCTAAENYMLKVSGQFSLHDINFQGAQRVSHNVIIGGGDASSSFSWSVNRVNGGYARQYNLVLGGTNVDQPGNFGEASLENLMMAGNGLPNTAVGESDPTGGGDIFLRYGQGNFQTQFNTAFFGIGGANGTHHIFAYNGHYVTLSNAYFAPLTANGAVHSSIYVLDGVHHTYDNLYDENGYFLHAAGGSEFDIRQVQMRRQLTTHPHQAMLFDVSTSTTMSGVFTEGLPIVFTAGGVINHQQVKPGPFGAVPAYGVNLCAGAGCITRSGTTITVTTASPHTFRVNDWVQINAVADATYNGTFQVTGAADNTHFTYTDAAAVSASSQGGSAALGCCLVASTATNFGAQDSHPFLSLGALWNWSGTNADMFSAVTTNLAAKNQITFVPANIPGAVGSGLPSTIPAGFHFLDLRGGVPTFLTGATGAWNFGTAANPTVLQVSNTIIATGSVNGATAFMSKNGSDTAGLGPYYAMSNLAADRRWYTQLGASNDYNWWYWNGTTWTKYVTISPAGTVTAPNFAGALSGNAGTASALAVDPADCSGNNFAVGINASGVAQCAQPSFANLSGSATAGQLPATVVYTGQSNAYTTGTQDFESAAVTRPFRRLAFASFPATCTANREFLERSDPAASGQVLYVCNATGNGWDLVGDGGGGTPGGSDTQIQYNNAGAFGGISNGSAGQCLTSNGVGVVPSFQACGAGGGANTALSNLASVAVNTALLPGSDNAIDLDSSAFRWRDAWFSRNLVVGPLDASLSALTQAYTGKSFSRVAVLNSATASVQFALTGAIQDNTLNGVTGVVGYAAGENTTGAKSSVAGGEFDAYCNGAGGTCSNVFGTNVYTQQSSGTTVGTNTGFTSYQQVNSGATAATNLFGYQMVGINLDANITVAKAAGIRVEPITKSTGIITNSIGLDIANQTAGASNYAIKTGTGLVSFGDTTSAPIFDAATGYRVGGAAAAGNVLRGNGTNFVSAILACADVTNCAPLAASGTAGAGPSQAGTASTAARSDHDHRSFATLTWYFPGTPATGVSPMILAVPQGIVNGTILGMQVTVSTTSASSSSFNLQRCTAGCTGASPTFSNIYSSDNTLSASTSEADFGSTNLTPTLNAKDQFKANLVSIGSGLANVTITLTYKYDTTN